MTSGTVKYELVLDLDIKNPKYEYVFVNILPDRL